MKSFFLILVLLAVLAATLWWAIYVWKSVDVEMSIRGYIAMILGIVFSLVIGCGLMASCFTAAVMGTTNHPTAVEANQCVSLCSKRQMDEWCACSPSMSVPRGVR